MCPKQTAKQCPRPRPGESPGVSCGCPLGGGRAVGSGPPISPEHRSGQNTGGSYFGFFMLSDSPSLDVKAFGVLKWVCWGSPGGLLGSPGVSWGSPGAPWGSPGGLLGSPGVSWGLLGSPGVMGSPKSSKIATADKAEFPADRRRRHRRHRSARCGATEIAPRRWI